MAKFMPDSAMPSASALRAALLPTRFWSIVLESMAKPMTAASATSRVTRSSAMPRLFRLTLITDGTRYKGRAAQGRAAVFHTRAAGRAERQREFDSRARGIDAIQRPQHHSAHRRDRGRGPDFSRQ